MIARVLHVAPACLACLLLGCGLAPETVKFDDPRVVPLMAAVNAVDRRSIGFTSIDPRAQLKLEWRPRAEYDAMLHVYAASSRTIAFRRRSDRFEWIGEQEVFQGPREYDTPDGRLHEEVVVTFDKEPVSGVPPNRLDVRYTGEDPRLANRRNLLLADVIPVLAEWGYPR